MENQIKIKIFNNEFIVKKTFKAIIIFEEMTGKSINDIQESIGDIIKLFFCYLKAGNRETFKYTIDEFIDLLDENQNILSEFSEYLKNQVPNI